VIVKILHVASRNGRDHSQSDHIFLESLLDNIFIKYFKNASTII
jgi:hypothetical protein